MLDQVCAQLVKTTEKNKGQIHCGHVTKLVIDIKNNYLLITHHTIKYVFKLYGRESSKEKNAFSIDSTGTGVENLDEGSGSASRNNGGQSRGSTDNAKFEREEVINLA